MVREFSCQQTNRPSPRKHAPLQGLYCGIQIQPTGDCPSFCIYIHDGFYGIDYINAQVCPLQQIPETDGSMIDQELLSRMEEIILSRLSDYAEMNHCKFLAAGISVEEGDTVHSDIHGRIYWRRSTEIGRLRLHSRLWFELDCVPFLLHTRGASIDEHACSAVRKAVMFLHGNSVANIPRISVGYRHLVEVDCGFRVIMADLDDYQATVSESVWKSLLAVASRVGKRINFAFFSATSQGGGVALMRHALVRIMHLLEVPCSWFVVKPKPDAFDITKRKFHSKSMVVIIDVLQGVAPSSTHLTQDDICSYEEWCKDNAFRYWTGGVFNDLHVAIIDDPQPSGLIPWILKANPKCKIIYRSHIQIRSDLVEAKGTEQHSVWEYLNGFIKDADVFISHPVPDFIPSSVPIEKRFIMPASTDPLDGLNKQLSDRDIDFYLRVFNRISFDQSGNRADFSRRFICQIARFDPSKGIPDLIQAYALFRQLVDTDTPVSQVPQLIIAGHGSVDDPDGAVVYEQVLGLLQQEEFSRVSHDIIVVRVPPSDQILNALMASALFCTQLSIREGFEIKVTEAITKGVPVIAYATGGIPYQIRHGFNGYLCKTGDIDTVAELMYLLLKNSDVYQKMRQNCLDSAVDSEFFSVFQASNWLNLIEMLHKGTIAEKHAELLESRGPVKPVKLKESMNLQEFRQHLEHMNSSQEFQLVENSLQLHGAVRVRDLWLE